MLFKLLTQAINVIADLGYYHTWLREFKQYLSNTTKSKSSILNFHFHLSRQIYSKVVDLQMNKVNSNAAFINIKYPSVSLTNTVDQRIIKILN
jgi:hypothetical protein